jgi:hypothetical protein
LFHANRHYYGDNADIAFVTAISTIVKSYADSTDVNDDDDYDYDKWRKKKEEDKPNASQANKVNKYVERENSTMTRN